MYQALRSNLWVKVEVFWVVTPCSVAAVGCSIALQKG
jgi:hypothetical protein